MFISPSRGRRLPTVVSALLVTPLVAVSTVLAMATPCSSA
jgi:hypothetical protein